MKVKKLRHKQSFTTLTFSNLVNIQFHFYIIFVNIFKLVYLDIFDGQFLVFFSPNIVYD